ncbi:MAG TPA: hypothetical protein VK527_00500 [Candidatus Limnocylindrales bacterium]|nr:hypothetical protein [Candidatus Limnocylindrales bacterium]
MSDRADRRYVDHPAPSVGLMAILLLTIVGVIAALPPSAELSPAFLAGVLLILAILCFYLWPLYSTYYTVSSAGIQVRYGPWTRQYPWSDFATVYWQKGLFATRIGWPSVTPCVRLSDGVLLKRRARGFGLYLTPNDSRALIRRIAEFAPDLTAEAII